MEVSLKNESMDEMSGEGVDIDLYADDIEQDFNTDEFGGDGVDLYDDVIANTSDRRDSESDAPLSTSPTTSTTSHNNLSKSNSISELREGRDRDGITPLRKHQAYVGGLTWWTSDKIIREILGDIGVNDFLEVKFYENRANGQSKGYCVLTVGSDNSLRLIHEKLPKKEIHGQTPVVTPPTKQALNQFESQSKTRPAQGPNNSNNNQGGGGNMNMMGGPMGGPRGPPMGGPQMGPMGFGPRGMMMPMRGAGPRMPPGMPPRNMGPPNQQGPPPGYNNQQRPPNMGPQNQGPPNQGPPQRPPMQDPYFQGPPGPMGGPQGMPPRGPMSQQGMDPRGPPPRNDWNRPPMNNYPPPHGQPQPSGPMQGPRGLPPQVPPQMIPGPPPGAPAPHMNPAFFNPPGGPQGPPQVGPPPSYGGPPRSGPGGYPPGMDHREPAVIMSEAEFEEVMGRNRTVSSSAISRAVADAATGEFASAIETLVTAISLIKQSKVANDDRCKILVSSLQDTLHGIETKSYGRRVAEDRSRSRERERHSRRSRRERSRSRERDYRDRSRERDRYYEYPRERSRSREYRERPREDPSQATGNRGYYEERDRYQRERTERERRVVDPDRSRERERDPDVHRATRH